MRPLHPPPNPAATAPPRRRSTRPAITLLAAVLPALALLPLASRPATGELELGGYYEHALQLDYAERTDEILYDASKLRIDLAAGAGGPVTFRGNVHLIHQHATLPIDAIPYLPEAIAGELAASGVSTQLGRERSCITLDNAFLTWRRGGLRLRAGKQQLSWGPGYSLNPTDLFHRKNPLDPTYEQEGVAALRLDYQWGIGGQLTLIATPDDDLEGCGTALRLATHAARLGYDLALTAHSVIDSTSVDPQDLTPRDQDRTALGLELSGALLGLGVWVEGNHNWMEEEEDFLRVIAGCDYTWPNGCYLILEGLFNGRAENDVPYPLHDWVASLFYGEPPGPGWGLLGLRRDFGALTQGALYVFGSPAGSLLLSPRLEFSLADNADLLLLGAATLGDAQGAFAPGLVSLLARATVYF